ncbi:restriction endonuclease subunit S [Enterococcus sp. BWM-S5]|uniref:Restriction endonuclease subunit S n=1 Tax=Enterococcus larvae TaxID=2794352 RepID=A0ABS4CLE8_9ENTE|nr:restriction endonuclease subunit S [Enterococcus larvae]MBP1047293.1 restriction endonuclease subunit S [Enterococcus larvae]
MTNRKEPEIRFSGFDDAWKQKKLGEVFNQTVEYVNPNEANLALWSVTVENGLTPKTERYNREALVKKNDKFKVVHVGDIVYNPMNLTIGAVGFNKSNHSVAVSGYYITMNMNDEFSNSYFSIWLTSPNAIKQYKLYATGSLIEKQRVQFPILSLIKTYIPSCKEQEEIGTFFKKIDDAIALHQQELSTLKQTKQGFLQKMFPKEGKKVPEIRFPGFTDDWEQRKLGELAEIIGGGTPSTSNIEYWNGDIDWYSPAEIGEQIYVSGSKKKITEKGLRKSSAKIHPVGTVLFTSRAGIGNTAILAKEGATNQGFQSIIPKETLLDSYFVFSRTHELKRYGEMSGAGSTFVEVSGKQMAKMPILVPNFNEQKKIGAFFKQLDNTIALHQRELELLQATKKAFLQKMFV